MADKKISALTSASTPLDGTEVLPIVQSSTTVKVANNDLRPKQIQSNATSGVLQVTGPAAASTRIATVPDANFTVARTDAAQSFTGDQTLGTGNLIQGTAAKGINFTANTPLAGKTTQLLSIYEEGTWTPVWSGGTITNLICANYVQVGKLIHCEFSAVFGTSVGVTNSTVSLPVTGKNGAGGGSVGYYSGTANAYIYLIPDSTVFSVRTSANAAVINDATLAGKVLYCSFTYRVA